MGCTTVRDRAGAVSAAARLATGRRRSAGPGGSRAARLPLLVDQVAADNARRLLDLVGAGRDASTPAAGAPPGRRPAPPGGELLAA